MILWNQLENKLHKNKENYFKDISLVSIDIKSILRKFISYIYRAPQLILKRNKNILLLQITSKRLHHLEKRLLITRRKNRTLSKTNLLDNVNQFKINVNPLQLLLIKKLV